MTQTTAELLTAALKLPDTERANLAANLIESLDQGADSEEEGAWEREIQDRLDDLKQGIVHPVPWTEGAKRFWTTAMILGPVSPD